MRRSPVLLVVALALVVSGCGSRVVSVPRPPSASYAAASVTWAQHGTIHYGSRSIRVGGRITRLWRTAYGFVVGRPHGGDLDTTTAYSFADGHRVTALGSDLQDVQVSPDGRYVGWLDFDGPKEPHGHLAEAVVLDLRTGKQVLSSHRDMGGPGDDLSDLYEDSSMAFLGFDRHAAYWVTPEGRFTTHRATIGSWTVGYAGRKLADGTELPTGTPYDAMVGQRTGMARDGRASSDGDGPLGFVSPDRRWCVTPHDPRLPTVVDCRTATGVTPRYPSRFGRFGGWLAADRYLVLTTPSAPLDSDRDLQHGTFSTCVLPRGRCTRVGEVPAAASVVLAVGVLGY